MLNLARIDKAQQLAETYVDFIGHMESLVRFLQIASGNIPWYYRDDDVCNFCGSSGANFHRAILDLSRYEKC